MRGHPFQVALSRRLAARGHEVAHAYFAGDPGPKGALRPRGPDDPVRFLGIGIGRPYDKGALVGRHLGDVRLRARGGRGRWRRSGRRWWSRGTRRRRRRREVMRASCRARARRSCSGCRISTASRCRGCCGGGSGRRARRSGRSIGRWSGGSFGRATGSCVITDDFRPLAEAWAERGAQVATIENWGALDEIWPGTRDNGFAREFGLADGFNFLYAGTLGLKHDPALLIALAEAVRGRGRMVVVGQGSGMGGWRRRAPGARQPGGPAAAAGRAAARRAGHRGRGGVGDRAGRAGPSRCRRRCSRISAPGGRCCWRRRRGTSRRGWWRGRGPGSWSRRRTGRGSWRRRAGLWPTRPAAGHGRAGAGAMRSGPMTSSGSRTGSRRCWRRRGSGSSAA